jgi:hypothetical protein
MTRRGVVCTLLLATSLFACASLGSLGNILQAPVFQAAANRNAELRLVGPSVQRPLGGAALRLWAHVQNPNPLGLTLSALAGTLSLEGVQAAQVSFPLGVPMLARADTIIPLDLTFSFSDLPNLAGVAQRALTGAALAYQLNGTVTVDAGPLGRPSFGPSTLLTGSVRPLR